MLRVQLTNERRAVADYWSKVDPELGSRISQALSVEAKQLSSTSA